MLISFKVNRPEMARMVTNLIAVWEDRRHGQPYYAPYATDFVVSQDGKVWTSVRTEGPVIWVGEEPFLDEQLIEEFPFIKGESYSRRWLLKPREGTLTFSGTRGAYGEDSREVSGLEVVSYETAIPAMRPEEDFSDFCVRMGGYHPHREFHAIEVGGDRGEPPTRYYAALFSALKGRKDVSPEEFDLMRQTALKAE